MKNVLKKSLSFLLAAVLLVGNLSFGAAAVVEDYAIQPSLTIAITDDDIVATVYADDKLSDIGFTTLPVTDWAFYSDEACKFEVPSSAPVSGLSPVYMKLPANGVVSESESTTSVYQMTFSYRPKASDVSISSVTQGMTEEIFGSDFSIRPVDNIDTVKVSKPANGSLTYLGQNIEPETKAIISVSADGSFAGDLIYTAPLTGSFDTIDFTLVSTTHAEASAEMTVPLTEGITAPAISGTIAKTVTATASYTFAGSDFSSHIDLNNGTLEAIEITPAATARGTWYYDNAAFAGVKEITAANISKLKFTSGTSAGSASFTWRAKNQAGYSGSASGTVTVGVLTLAAYTAPASINKGVTWYAAAYHFAYTPNTNSISFIKIVSIPSSSYGYLYLTQSLSAGTGYPAISANTSINANAIIPASYLGYLRLSTSSSASASSISFTWTATIDPLISTATWAGAVSYKVNFAAAVTTLSAVEYETQGNDPVDFTASDFSAVFSSRTHTTLNYVRFTLPSTSYGRLYYNYTSASGSGSYVLAATKYYNNSTSPYLSNVTFLPATNYDGTVTISYTAYNTAGDAYTGTVRIIVGAGGGELGTIEYSVETGEEAEFDVSDFTDVFSDYTDLTLSYVKFSLPASSDGRLYYNYTSSSNYGSYVSSSTEYNRNSSPYIDYVSFVPASSSHGTVSIDYVAYSSGGDSYDGIVEVTIEGEYDDVSYETDMNEPVTFDDSDFNSVFMDSEGTSLSYVRFTLPSSSKGTLYYDYTDEDDYGSEVTASTKYYRSSSLYLSYVTFVPAEDFTGTVSINYTGYDSSGAYRSGTVTITVGSGAVPTVTNGYKATALSTTLNFTKSDFTALYSANDGDALAGITITSLPSSTYGKLYLNTVAITSGYYVSGSYLSLLKFVPVTGKSGSTSFKFTATDGDDVTAAATMSISIGTSALTGAAPVITSFTVPSVRSSSRTVIVSLSANDARYGTPAYMAFSVDGGSYGSWKTYSTSSSVTLPSGSGIHIIKVKVKNNAGTESSEAQTRVLYDDDSPTVLTASINELRDVVAIDFTEPISLASTSSVLESGIYFETDSGSTYYLESGDDVVISGSTLKIELADTLDDSYETIVLPKNAIEDKVGNTLSSTTELSLKDSCDYSFSNNSSTKVSTVTYPAGTPDSSGNVSFYVDSLSGSDLYSRSLTGSTLKLFLPVRSGYTVTGRTMYFAGGFLSASTANRIQKMVISDGSVDISIDTKALRSALVDADAPFSVVISAVSLTDAASANEMGIARSVRLFNAGYEFKEIPGRNTVRISIPYAGASNFNQVVVFSRVSASVYKPIYTSEYNSEDGYATAPVTNSGVYAAGINKLVFTDVAKSNSKWAQEYIDFLSARTVINGIGNNLFAGTNQLKKNEYIKMLILALDIYDAGATCSFTDVSTTDWAYHYIASAVKAGIISDGGKASQETYITREEMSLYAYNAAIYAGVQFTATETAVTFSDQSSISSACLTAVKTMQRAGIIAGYPDRSFKPKGNCQRDQATKIISMVMQKQAD